jgi:archaellum component FlaF (FlaF/FlaG flagellin family)
MGIPPAPGSTDTLGLRLRANIPGSAAAPVTSRPGQTLSGLSVSPTGQNFGTSYQLTFYAWSNFFGAANASGLADNAASEGGTNNVLFAVGTSGTVPLVVGNTGLAANASMDGIGFATTPDGGISNDWRVYPISGTIVPSATTLPSSTTFVYNAANVNSATANQNTNTYYTTTVTTLAPHTAPAAQQAIATAEYGSDASPVMAGSTQAGSFGFAWHKVVITKNGTTVSWDVDDFPIATYTITTGTLGGANIALGESDVNTSTARHPSLLFTVFDNLTVTDLPPAAQLGDFNNNGTVDAGDYDIWRKNDIANAALPNDGGALTQPDRYTVWRSHFGAPPGAGSSLSGVAVPEPSSLMLLVFGICTYCWPARRKS